MRLSRSLTRHRSPFARCLAAAALSATSLCGWAQAGITFHLPADNPKPSYSEAVEIKGGGIATLYVSALVPEPVDPAAKDAAATFGDTRAQTEGVLRRLKALLERRGYAMRDVVKVGVFLVADPAHGGSVDNAGFGAGYDAFFGPGAVPAPPARTRATVSALTNPLWRVAIDVIAAKTVP